MAIEETSKHPRYSANNASHLHGTNLQTQVKLPRETEPVFILSPIAEEQMEEECLCME